MKGSYQNFHTVRGTKRYGFIVDPGASGNLGGTDTKREYDDAKVPMFEQSEIVDSHSRFTGISGEAQKSCGML